MSSYDRRTRETLETMGTDASDWLPVPSKADEEGRPVFSFPEGYAAAPTPIDGDDCCGLCGAGIKNAHWISCASKKWILRVGSECVARFGDGRTGDEMAGDARRDEERKLLSDLLSAGKRLWDRHATGRPGHRRIDPAHYPATIEVRAAIKDLAGKTDPETSGAAAIARWAGKNSSVARELIARAEKLLAGR